MFVANRVASTCGKRVIRATLQVSHSDFECVGKQSIVAVEKDHIIASAFLQSPVSGCSRSARIRLPETANFRKTPGDIPTPIGRRSEERRVGKECRSRWSAYHVREERR